MSKVERSQNLSKQEQTSFSNMQNLYQGSPIPPSEQLNNLGVYLRRQDLTRILFISELFELSLQVPGDIYEFGVRWGQNLSLFSSLRGIHEPYNFTRRIFGFDTFEGFVGTESRDGAHSIIREGAYAVSHGYENHLDAVLHEHQSLSPISHIKRFELIKGDVTQTLPEHLDKYPESIISLAYFDFDIFKPTAEALKMIKERLVKGSIVAFDEINHSVYPGETVAIREVLGLNNLRLIRPRFSSTQAYYVYE
ncbi:MAG: hypothetical protein ACJAZT_002069 [Gammaproteobacteria bacterium]|jgi:hypothetical protein